MTNQNCLILLALFLTIELKTVILARSLNCDVGKCVNNYYCPHCQLFDPNKGNCDNIYTTDIVNKEDESNYLKCLWNAYYQGKNITQTTTTTTATITTTTEESVTESITDLIGVTDVTDVTDVSFTTEKEMMSGNIGRKDVKLEFVYYKKDKNGNYVPVVARM